MIETLETSSRATELAFLILRKLFHQNQLIFKAIVWNTL